jgi:thiol:disulfide interchange protein DsbC
MKKTTLSLALSAGLLFSGWIQADSRTSIETSLKRIMPGIQIDSVKTSPIPGLYEVMVGTNLLYVSDDGNYVIQGTLIDVPHQKNLTEAQQAESRLAALAKVGTSHMIVFKPKIQSHYVYVFTDIDCGYCRKLHSEIDQYLKEGIEVRYLFFPRAGEGSESWAKAVSVWCSKNRNEALTRAKKGEPGEADNKKDKTCDNPVSQHYALGNALGASGTPMIVTDRGQIIPGYVPAGKLADTLARKEAFGIDPGGEAGEL